MPKTWDDSWDGGFPNKTRKSPVAAGSNVVKSPAPSVTVPVNSAVPPGSVTIANGVPSAASGAVKRLLPTVL